MTIETKHALTDAELTDIYKEANGIVGKNPPITTQRIFAAMRLIYTIAQAEQREKDAMICEEIGNHPWADVECPTPFDCGDAIRNQGEQE